MDNRMNTIAGWALGAGIIALGGAILTGEFFHAERPEKMGYPIEGVVAEGEGGGAAAVPIETLLASADPAAGEAVFAKCAACHTITKGGANGIGPNLWGAIGKPHGHVAGFAYSDALKSVSGVWDWKGLDAWLTSPRKYAPGTKMTFAGLGKAEDRANLIAYMNQQSDAPLPMPAAAAAPAEGAAPAAEGDAPPTPAEGAALPPGAPSVDPAAAEKAADKGH